MKKVEIVIAEMDMFSAYVRGLIQTIDVHGGKMLLSTPTDDSDWYHVKFITSRKTMDFIRDTYLIQGDIKIETFEIETY